MRGILAIEPRSKITIFKSGSSNIRKCYHSKHLRHICILSNYPDRLQQVKNQSFGSIHLKRTLQLQKRQNLSETLIIPSWMYMSNYVWIIHFILIITNIIIILLSKLTVGQLALTEEQPEPSLRELSTWKINFSHIA